MKIAANKIGALSRVLNEKKTVISRAVFWRIPHNSGREDVRLKVGRYKKPKEFYDSEVVETIDPKSELTLDQEEFANLIDFLQEHYEPFKKGAKAYIPLDEPFAKDNADQLRGLFQHPEKQALLDFIVDNSLIPEDLIHSLEYRTRANAIQQFETMLANDLVEQKWQEWFEGNSWVLGSEFVRVLEERDIDTSNISDFLMEAYDGFLDIVEIKRPEGGMKFWSTKLDHGNYVPSMDLIKAITQASTYINEVEREANSLKFLERVDSVKTVKPRCILIFGRSQDWNPDQKESYRILNSSYHNLTVLTYDHVLARSKRVLGLEARRK